MNPDNSHIKRDLEDIIRKYLSRGKVIILYGARRIGKTTLFQNIFSPKDEVLYLSCDQSRIQEQITPDSLVLRSIVGDYKNIIFDEAQYLSAPGLILKILIDNFP
ncbi:MAG: AAA family ATPase, partial [Patescibacteria group bacterium]